MKDTVKIVIIGAGSNFCALTINDIFLDDQLNNLNIEICLMDILQEPLNISERYAFEVAGLLGRNAKIWSTTSLEKALDDADFAITAIEVGHFYYWSMDFHIPRRYGFNQIYGENGGPGGMFHFLRNIGPMLEIAKTMERVCPDAWLINYTNPEAKIVDAISRLISIKVVGLCHGIGEGQEMLSRILELPKDELDVTVCGLNHFGWYQKIRNKRTGEDLYPLLKEKERKVQWLASWDGMALSRIMLRTYGLLPYPITNHIGEYIRWADSFIASPNMQFFYDPATEDPWRMKNIPPLVYLADDVANTPFFKKEDTNEKDWLERRFSISPDGIKPSEEYGVPIISAMIFDRKTELLTVNMQNRGKVPGLPYNMAVELPAYADKGGIHAKEIDPLPDAITEIIRIQGVISGLLIDAYIEKSRYKLLQALLLDPTLSTYNSAVALINEMCDRQKEILPPMQW